MVNVRPYHTPPGKVDFPFAYVFDASGIADAQAVRQNNAVQLQGDSEFILRHIAGVNLCVATGANGGRFSYRDAEQRYAQGNPSAGIVFPANWPVVPEKLWPSENSAILFDLYQTLRNATVCGETPIYNSYIAFFGVKRFTGQAYRTPYEYWEQKYAYSFDLTINWNHFSAGTTVAPPRRFFVLIDRYDFELMRVAITLTTTGGAGRTGGLTTNDFQILAFDANMRAFSSLPLNQFFINSARPTAATAPVYQPAIAPSVVYPVGSAITFDITSMLCNGVGSPQTYNIAFDGIWRMPKSGRI
jgi:hypothetical protein